MKLGQLLEYRVWNIDYYPHVDSAVREGLRMVRDLDEISLAHGTIGSKRILSHAHPLGEYAFLRIDGTGD